MNADSDLIDRLAKLAGVKSDTIRFYERSGLLPKPKRKMSGYRVYDDAALKRVRFIKKAQSLGFADALSENLARWRKMSGEGRHVADEFCKLIESSSTEP